MIGSNFLNLDKKDCNRNRTGVLHEISRESFERNEIFGVKGDDRGKAKRSNAFI